MAIALTCIVTVKAHASEKKNTGSTVYKAVKEVLLLHLGVALRVG